MLLLPFPLLQRQSIDASRGRQNEPLEMCQQVPHRLRPLFLVARLKDDADTANAIALNDVRKLQALVERDDEVAVLLHAIQKDGKRPMKSLHSGEDSTLEV